MMIYLAIGYNIVMFHFATCKMLPLHWISIHQSAEKRPPPSDPGWAMNQQTMWICHQMLARPAVKIGRSPIRPTQITFTPYHTFGEKKITQRSKKNADTLKLDETWTWKPTSVYYAHNHLINPKIHKLSAQYSVTIQVHHQKCFGRFTSVNPYPNHFQSQTDLIWYDLMFMHLGRNLI